MMALSALPGTAWSYPRIPATNNADWLGDELKILLDSMQDRRCRDL